MCNVDTLSTLHRLHNDMTFLGQSRPLVASAQRPSPWEFPHTAKVLPPNPLSREWGHATVRVLDRRMVGGTWRQAGCQMIDIAELRCGKRDVYPILLAVKC